MPTIHPLLRECFETQAAGPRANEKNNLMKNNPAPDRSAPAVARRRGAAHTDTVMTAPNLRTVRVMSVSATAHKDPGAIGGLRLGRIPLDTVGSGEKLPGT